MSRPTLSKTCSRPTTKPSSPPSRGGGIASGAPLQSYNLEIVMEVARNLKLSGTRLVINAGDRLNYGWEGEY